MPVFETFSRRMRHERGDYPEVFQTDKISPELQAHLHRIVSNVIGEASQQNWMYNYIGYVIKTEYPHLFKRSQTEHYIPNYVLRFGGETEYPDDIKLDVVELAFSIRAKAGGFKAGDVRPPVAGLVVRVPHALQDEVDDLNLRFRQAGYGYQLENYQLVPMDSLHTHAEAVKPALVLLREAGFEAALEAFYSAFEAYKRAEMRTAIKLCGDALDSTMKAIFAELAWEAPNSNNFQPYVRKAMELGLLPTALETHYNHLAGLIVAGPGNLRNTMGGHGAGPDEVDPPEYFVHYMINMTASTILFLVQAYRQYKGAGESPAAAP